MKTLSNIEIAINISATFYQEMWNEFVKSFYTGLALHTKTQRR